MIDGGRSVVDGPRWKELSSGSLPGLSWWAMKLKHLFAAGLLSLLSVGAQAASDFSTSVQPFIGEKEETALNALTLDASYTGGSEFKFVHKGRGSATTFRSHFEYTHRIPISGPWHFQIGVDYDRLDFGGSALRTLPGTLQTVNVPIGISYMVDGNVGFLVEMRPGFNFEQSITRGAVDVPFNIGGGIPLVEGKLYGVWGVGTSILRRYPVIPVVGVVWLINDDLRLLAYLPEPKIVYDVTKDLSLWAGGEIIANSFKVGKMSREHLSNTVVDYQEYRVGAGLSFSPCKDWTLTAGAGCSVQRSFDFWRAKESYTAEPAPYARIQLTGTF